MQGGPLFVFQWNTDPRFYGAVVQIHVSQDVRQITTQIKT